MGLFCIRKELVCFARIIKSLIENWIVVPVIMIANQFDLFEIFIVPKIDSVDRKWRVRACKVIYRSVDTNRSSKSCALKSGIDLYIKNSLLVEDLQGESKSHL